MSDKLDRLPRWARDEIENSRRKIASLEEAIRMGTTNPNFPRTNLYVTRDHMEWQPSAFYAGRVMLGPNWDDFVDFRHEVMSGRQTVHVHSGFSHLIVRPRAGNAITLMTER